MSTLQLSDLRKLRRECKQHLNPKGAAKFYRRQLRKAKRASRTPEELEALALRVTLYTLEASEQ